MKYPTIPYKQVRKDLLVVNFVMAIFYFTWWLSPTRISNLWLFCLLLFGEIYHLFMAFTFWFTIWPVKKKTIEQPQFPIFPTVDVFIAVAGEPLHIIRQTALAAREMSYPVKNIYILNDGYVAKKDNWQEVEAVARQLNVKCITRKTPGGAKAGNINHALSLTSGSLIALFDADMVPYSNFLQKTVPYFADPTIGFIQTPQYYNNSSMNPVTSGSWDQQKFFFGPILRGKDKDNASFICGTNVVIRRRALEEVGGMVSNNIAEDFLTSLLIHQKGWKSHYIPDVLAEGLAPQDLGSYYKQQFRWARGSLEVLFGQNPLLKRNLTWAQRIHYLSSALYYFNGLIVLIDIVMPLIFLFTAIQPVYASTTSFALYFLPFMFFNLYTLQITSGDDISFNTFSFSYSAWFLQLTALISLLFGISVGFSVTPKQAQKGIFPKLVIPHLTYILLAVWGSILALHREGLTPAVATNIAWAVFNTGLFLPFILVALNLYPFKPAVSREATLAADT